MKIKGLIEKISPNSAIGWAFNEKSPTTQVEVVAYYDGNVIASALANQKRQDLLESNLGSGHHGFSLTFPQNVMLDEKLVIRVTGSNKPLEITQEARDAGGFEGYVEHLGPRGAFGWVWAPFSPERVVDVVIKEGDDIIGEGSASNFRADLKAAGKRGGVCGFWVQLSRDAEIGRLVVQVVGTKVSLPLATTLLPPSTLEQLSAASSLVDPVDLQDKPVRAQPVESAPVAMPPSALPTADYHLLAAHFDPEFYWSRNANDLAFGADPIIHFAAQGWREGRSPTAEFSVIDYLADFEDVLLSGGNPFLHYLRDGRDEGRKILPSRSPEAENSFRQALGVISAAFDAEHYAAQLKTVDFSDASSLLHYALFGWRRQIEPCAWFSCRDYMLSYPDVRAANIDPLFHFLSFGKKEGRQPTRRIRDEIINDFDIDFYLRQNPPLYGVDPADHFVAFGWRQGYNPHPDFDVKYYMRMNPDVAKANLNPFWHYVVAGKSEGRPAFQKSSRKIAVDSTLPKLLFVGHDAIHAGAEVVLLETIKWFANHTRYPIKLLLLGPGRLVARYAEYADTHVLVDSLAEAASNIALTSFLNDNFAYCYVNTVAASRVWKLFSHCPAVASVPLLLHVHEMEMVIRDFQQDFDAIYPHVSSMIAVSTAVRDALINSFRCDPEKIFLSNAFINVIANTSHESLMYRQAARQELQVAASDFVVVGCGTVYHRKGPDYFLETALKCVERGIIPEAKFVWIGGGEDLETLRGQVALKGFGDRIRFIGENEKANELVAAGDVFFLSSREDPFPLVCMEAAQYGIPTIYFTGATGISEFCGMDAGVGVPAFDTEAVLQVLSLYYKLPLRLEKAGAAARARLLEGYTSRKRVLEIAIHAREIAGLPPSATVIVPAYNHEKFIRARLDSILSQTIGDIDILVLDDCSTDGTTQVVNEYLTDPRVRFIRNETNTGSPFMQWLKGAELANAELIWVAEGDDLASHDFLEKMLPAFDDPQVNLAFCRTEIVNEFGVLQPGALDPYYKTSDFPFWGGTEKMDGLTAVEKGFGFMCLIVNGSATVIRRDKLIAGVAIAKTYKMCGDWYVYLSALVDAKLVYTTAATNYFRRHASSAVHKIEGTPQYFSERAQIAEYVVDTFNLSRRSFRMIMALLDGEWSRFANRNPGKTKADMFDSAALLAKHNARCNKPSLRIGLYVHGMLFSKGGIERLASQLANGLANRGHSVFIFCRDWGGARPVYGLNESIKVIDVFDEDNVNASSAKLRVEFAKADLDVFVPMLSEWLFEPLVDACHGLGIPVIASEHNDPAKIEELWWARPRRLACFEKVDAVHLLLERFKTSLPDTFQDRIYIIPNGVALTPPPSGLAASSRPLRIIGVGRLEQQKRFDRLIKAFIRAASAMQEWRLDIYGEGSQRGMLQALIDNAGLGGRIALRGTTPGIAAELAASSIFVLPSEFEGFGIVILEAKNAALPCIGYTNCNGPNDLIRPGIDGLLVGPDEDGASLATALADLAADEPLRARMGDAARQDVARFDIPLIVEQWERMIISVVKSKLHEVISHAQLNWGAEEGTKEKVELALAAKEDTVSLKEKKLSYKKGSNARAENDSVHTDLCESNLG